MAVSIERDTEHRSVECAADQSASPQRSHALGPEVVVVIGRPRRAVGSVS